MPARIYARTSSSAQRDNFSIASQEARARAWCGYQALAEIEVYSEPTISGKRNDRPQLLRLLDDLRRGDTVVVYSLSRLGRGGAVQLLGIVDRIQQAGARLVSLTENIDTDTPAGRLMLTILAALAEMELETTRERMDAGRTQAATQGIFPHSSDALPTGWKRSETGYVVEDEHAPLVRAVIQRSQGGRPFLAVAAEMNKAGLLTPNGRQWTVTQVRRIVLTEAYCTGVIQYRSHVAPDRPASWIRIPAPPLVSRAEWEAAQRGAALNHVHRKADKYPLSARLFCACGAALQGRENEVRRGDKIYGRTRYYRCQASVRKTPTCPANGRADKLWRAEGVETAAREALALALESPEMLALLTAQPATPDPHAPERERLEAKRGALIDLYLEQAITREEMTARRDELTAQIEFLTPTRDAVPAETPDAGGAAIAARVLAGADWRRFVELLDVRFALSADGAVRVEHLTLPESRG